MRPLVFDGTLEASKSVMNRLLVLKSFQNGLSIVGDAGCDDVQAMKEGLAVIEKVATGAADNSSENYIDCREAAAVLRFLAIRASRERGLFHFTGSPRLFSRPLQALFDIFDQLGVNYSLSAHDLTIESQGWKDPRGPIVIDRSQSSQFASGFLLSSWYLPFPLVLHWSGHSLSDGYWQMTMNLVRRCGLNCNLEQDTMVIPSQQAIVPQKMVVEQDMSSAFSLAALAALSGAIRIQNFPSESTQPDFVFVDILERMGVDIKITSNTLLVSQGSQLLPIEWNLASCPDLFPVLSILCAFSNGVSRLYGAPHLAHKESHRIDEIVKILTLLGRKVEILTDGLVILGNSCRNFDREIPYQLVNDHRMAMAASIACAAGAPLKISRSDNLAAIVAKSFPGFVDHVGGFLWPN